MKPGNIKIKPDGRVKVLDFGLTKNDPHRAQWRLSNGDHQPNRGGRDSGHGVLYVAGAGEGKPVDHRADIYSFGAILYELITGKRLHGGETTTDVLASVIKEEREWDKVPRQVQKLLR